MSPPYSVARYRASFVGDYDMRWVERLIPSLLILWRSVLGCRFRILAAPFGSLDNSAGLLQYSHDVTTLHVF